MADSGDMLKEHIRRRHKSDQSKNISLCLAKDELMALDQLAIDHGLNRTQIARFLLLKEAKEVGLLELQQGELPL